jgi:hypothetical protein
LQAKQRERKALKQAMVNEQRGYDDDAAAKEALQWQVDQHVKREKMMEIQLALAKQGVHDATQKRAN